MNTLQQLTNTINEGGRRNYAEYGNVVPVVFSLRADGKGLGVMPSPPGPDERIAHVFGRLVSVMSSLINPRWYVINMEGWAKTLNLDTDAPAEEVVAAQEKLYPHGTLEREHDNDPTIHTVIATVGLDGTTMEHAHAFSEEKRGDHGELDWRIETDLQGDGYVLDMMKAGHLHGQENVAPKELQIELEWLAERLPVLQPKFIVSTFVFDASWIVEAANE